MSVGESLGSHSLHSFAEYLQHHINSPEASSYLTSRRKTSTVLKPFSLNFMATEKSVRKGGRQHRENTAKDLAPDIYELYKSDLEETYGECKNRIQWIRRHWAEEWFKYKFVTDEYAEKNAIKGPWEILYTKVFSPCRSLKLLLKASTPA